MAFMHGRLVYFDFIKYFLQMYFAVQLRIVDQLQHTVADNPRHGTFAAQGILPYSLQERFS